MATTHTEQRIRKLLARGLSVESIARKIGRPGPEGEERVKDSISDMAEEHAEKTKVSGQCAVKVSVRGDTL